MITVIYIFLQSVFLNSLTFINSKLVIHHNIRLELTDKLKKKN